SPSTANNFRAQASAIDDSNNPFPTIYDDLTSHPENGLGTVISFIPTNLKASVRALSDFHEKPDTDLRLADTITTLTGTLNASVPGTVLGKVDRVWIVEWKAIPDSYILSINTAGDRPLAIREYKEPELQGFAAIGERDDLPYVERQYQRHAGFGVRNRLSA